MDETLEAACLSLLCADDDYAEAELRARQLLARHGTSLVLALAELAARLADTAADAQGKLRALAGEFEPEIAGRDVIHVVAAEDVGRAVPVDVGGEGG